MSELKATGTVHKIYPVQEISATFKKQEFVIKTEGEYPQFVKFECNKEKIEKLNGIAEGDDVTVYFNLSGREWTNPQGEIKYFTNLTSWRIEKGAEVTANVGTKGDISDDLPF